MQIENFNYDTIQESREVVEGLVNQSYCVAIWYHSDGERAFFGYTRSKLPEGFHMLMDIESFTTKTPIEGTSGIQVKLDLGEVEEDLMFDNLAEALARYDALIKETFSE